MRWFDRPPNADDNGPDPLDAILRDAEWPEIEPIRVARLQRWWSTITRRRRLRVRWLGVAAALIALVATTLAAYRREFGHHLERPSVTERGPVGQPPRPPHATEGYSHPSDQPSVVSVQPTGRTNGIDAGAYDPTTYERVVIAVAGRRFVQASAKPPGPSNGALERVLREAVRDPQADLRKLVKPLLDHRQTFERRLTEIIRQREGDGEDRLTAVRVLAQLATRRSLPLLIQWRQSPRARRDVTYALARLAPPLTLARLARIEPTQELQIALLASLLERGDGQAVELFLGLARQPGTSAAALKAVRKVTDPPLEMLFACLQVPQVRTRIAAARVLAELNDPKVSQRLIQMVFTSESSHEALVALSGSREPAAAGFVARAQLDLSLAASIRAAQRRLQSFPN